MRKPGDMLTVCHEPTEERVLLTNEEIRRQLPSGIESDGSISRSTVNNHHKGIAKAQLKKVVEYLSEHIYIDEYESSIDPEIWQALLEEVT